MVEYNCCRCGYIASQKINLRHHLNRKNICKPLLADISIEDIKKYYGFIDTEDSTVFQQVKPAFEQAKPAYDSFCTQKKQQVKPALQQVKPVLQQVKPALQQVKPAFLKNNIMCEFCGKTFTRKYGLTCHLKRCKHKNHEESYIIKEKNNEIQELKEIVEKLLIENKNTITNQINNKDSFNTNNTIIINNYGDENTKYISSDYILKLLKNKPAKAIPELIKYTHFNEDHPENQNIKITNKKEPYVKIMKNNKWELQNKEDTITDLIDRQQVHLMEENMGKKIKSKCNKSEKVNIKRCNELYNEEDKDYMKRLYNESELVIINNS